MHGFPCSSSLTFMRFLHPKFLIVCAGTLFFFESSATISPSPSSNFSFVFSAQLSSVSLLALFHATLRM